MLRRLTRSLVLPALAVALACGGSGTSPTGPDGYPRGVALTAIPFCAPVSPDLRLDLHLPGEEHAGPVALTVFFHGGSWVTGERGGSPWLARLRGPLLESGIAVATADYRLAPTHPWPAQIEDAGCAIRFLRSRAMEYGLDPDRVGVWGESAGAHLAALIGTSDEETFPAPAHAGFSSRADAVVDLYGPADLTDERGWPLGTSLLFDEVFGSGDWSSPVLARASPATHVTSDDPPFLIVHGDRDRVVPVVQSIDFAGRLQAAGVEVDLVVVEGGDHGFTRFAEPFDPDVDAIEATILGFFRDRLR